MRNWRSVLLVTVLAVSAIPARADVLGGLDGSHASITDRRVATVPLTDEKLVQLERVNRQVNEGLTYSRAWAGEPDLPQARPLNVGMWGDCKNFAVTKAELLAREYGFPREALLYTTYHPKDAIGQDTLGHVFLLVRTDRGDLVLDDPTSSVYIRSWDYAGYAPAADTWTVAYTTADGILEPTLRGTIGS